MPRVTGGSARSSARNQDRVQNGADPATVCTHSVRVLGLRADLQVRGIREARIEAVASRQRGRINRRQLHAVGVSRWTAGRLVEQARLLPLGAAVFAVGHRAPTPWGDETTALLAVDHPQAMLSHASAARLWGLPLPADADDDADVLVPDGTRTRANGLHLHRTRNLAAQDARFRNQLPVTSPARTVLDLTPLWTPRQLELGVDRLLVAKLMRLADLAAALQGRSPAGARVLRQLLEAHQGTTFTRSEAEELALELIRGANLPQPLTNVRIAGYEVDFHWPEHKLVVEIDGYRFHSTRRAFEHDRRKAQALRRAGLTMLRFSYQQLRQEPLAVVAAIAGALAEGRPAAR